MVVVLVMVGMGQMEQMEAVRTMAQAAVGALVALVVEALVRQSEALVVWVVKLVRALNTLFLVPMNIIKMEMMVTLGALA